ncbi:MAG: hypothetical protein JSU01_02510 [Bacteroidetes bacterium]|nr:hypothetical protein [Bacteroidota bacterium]
MVESENLDQAFELISKFADSEEDRRKTIESKATLFLSTISIATTLVVASNTVLTGNAEKSWPVIASVAISFVLTVYTVCTVWYSVKALERGNYAVLGFKDLNHAGNTDDYKKHLILTMRKKTKRNFATIDEKIDYVTMAQAYYKRAIMVICLYALLILLFCLFYKPAIQPPKAKANETGKTANVYHKQISACGRCFHRTTIL